MQTKYLNIFSRVLSLFLLVAVLIGALPTITLAAPSGTQKNNKVIFTHLDLYPNIETIGVVVSGIDLPEKADLVYRKDNEKVWHTGYPLMRIDDGRLVGSLFELSPETTYTIKVLSGATEISFSISTQPENLEFTPLAILHVDTNASPGGDGSISTPFKKIQDGVDHAAAGTQVLVADGVYHETITFPNPGAEGNWIQVKAVGDGAILDGSKNFSGDIWNSYKKADIWTMKAENYFEYLARDEQRFYNYSNLQSLLNGTKGEGWYLDRNTLKLYVRTQNDPAQHTWQMPYLNRAFDIDSRDWLWIEGFEMQFYGTQSSRSGIYAKDASHIVIRKNKIHNIQLGIFINWTGGDERGNDTRIEYNEIYDPPVNEWAWDDVKGSSMEGTGIVLRGHIGAIVRENKIHNFFNGIYTGSSAANVLNNAEVAFDIDVYNNHIYDISDDALEPEGACVNHRFRNNTVDSAFVGLSLAPITIGPTWVLRSTFSNYTERGIKWANNSDGIVLIYHNTFWTMAEDIAAMDFITPAHNATLRNNIFQNNGYAIYEVRWGSSNHDWDNNNWYSSHSPLFKWEGAGFADITAFCSATGQACNSHSELPNLRNPNIGDFTLNASSTNIDQGVVILGINDSFNDTAPDIGRYEYRSPENISPTSPPPASSEVINSEPKPTSADSPPSTELVTEIFTSNGRNDGWVLESSENSNQGGIKNTKSDTLVVGDDNQNNQYQSILDFTTRRLPNDIVITEAILMIKKYDTTAPSPFITHQNILIDIQYGAFGFIGPFQYRGLQSADFQNPSCQDASGIIQDAPVEDWYWAILDTTALHCINPRGITQLRLRFQVSDNNDTTTNAINFYSGNYEDSEYHPHLLIKYEKKR